MKARIAHVVLVGACQIAVFLLLVALGGAAAGQTPSEGVTVDLPAGATYVAVRAVNTAGLQSGYSNVVRVDCATACRTGFAWDRNTETDLASYVLVWGAASGVYTSSVTVLPSTTPGRLPVPSLRIRRAP